jgi:hypothetical protein
MIPFRIGADASCTDGACGQVSRIIVNPVAREVTHLVVDPKHRHGPGRLVPADLLYAATGQIRLRCSLAEFKALRPAEETESVPGLDPTGHGHARVQKQHGVGGIVWSVRDPDAPQAPREVTVDSVPPGEIEVHRELTVCATDGDRGHQVTHVLLQQGHMRGRKEVAIPIGAVTKIGTLLIHLSLTRHQVKDLPPVDIDHPAR